MNAPTTLSRIVEGLEYSVERSTLIADDAYWDGRNFERNFRNTFLYRTPNGRFFVVILSQWQGEPSEELTPITADEAVDRYEGSLTEHHVAYREAFPYVEVEPA